MFVTSLPTNADYNLLERGQRLFLGQESLIGRISGQDFDLPVEASRCVNCHISDQASQASEIKKKTQVFGPRLNQGTLLNKKSLRGGPAFSYTPKSFCRLLKTGIDPNHIMSKRSMPRYKISNKDCKAIWQYVVNIQVIE